MPVRRRILLLSVAAAACLSAVAVFIFAGSGGDDEKIAVPVPDPAASRYCAALHRRLPATVAGMSRRTAEPRSELTAAWGNPAIVLRCGVPRPAADDDVSTPGAEVGGVDWSFEQGADGSARLTTTLRRAYVEVVLPKKYAHDVSPLSDLAAAVKQSVPAGI